MLNPVTIVLFKCYYIFAATAAKCTLHTQTSFLENGRREGMDRGGQKKWNKNAKSFTILEIGLATACIPVHGDGTTVPLQRYLHISRLFYVLASLLAFHKTIIHHSILDHLKLKLYSLFYIFVRHKFNDNDIARYLENYYHHKISIN